MHSGRDMAAAVKQAESVKPTEPVHSNEAEEKVDLDEIKEEIEEVKEIEEVAEEKEKVVEEEAEETFEQNVTSDSADTRRNADIDMKDYEIEDDEAEKHAELLALPPHGSEVLFSALSSDVSEEDLKKFCESVGKVTQIRKWKGWDSSQTLRYAFVVYENKELAEKAVKGLKNTKFKGKKVSCSIARSQHRLYICDIPRSLTAEVLREAVEKMGPGVNQVDLIMEKPGRRRNRGFAFVEYYNHACAEYSLKKMCDPKFKLDSNTPTVTWADPRSGDSSASQVKAIRVKNLPENVTRDQLRRLFEHHGEIAEVTVPTGRKSRFGFVHFAEQSAAMKALRNSEKYHLDGRVLECSLTKRPTAKGPNTPNCP